MTLIATSDPMQAINPSETRLGHGDGHLRHSPGCPQNAAEPESEGAPATKPKQSRGCGGGRGAPGRYLRSAARPGLLAAASGGRGGAGLAGPPPPGRAVSGPSCRRSRPEPGSSPAPARVGGSAGAGPPGPSARRPPAAARPAPRRPSRGRGRCGQAGRRVRSPPGTPRGKQGRPRNAREAGVRMCSPRVRHRAVPGSRSFACCT
ncbi:unnamed protein product [Rangifer tarandus platyrhynchus]|uniref:Uncharacterized protein n=2 Tax=Rangifer tarandus platyrhynchus TaxID=3082113 RepID=A0ABN8ZTP1_RANTA|nr:unnamed protein product [Rangifer tarandus platyrhynchus]CAI9710123.1 unnamed protein product [Rangifer tarandus platyrhynchus]